MVRLEVYASNRFMVKIFIYKAAYLSVCVCHTCVRLAHRLVFVPHKLINLGLFWATLLGLIGGLSKNAVNHDDQLDKTKMYVISNDFGKFVFCQKTFSLIFKSLKNLKSHRIMSQFLPIDRVFGGKVTYQNDRMDKMKILNISYF